MMRFPSSMAVSTKRPEVPLRHFGLYLRQYRRGGRQRLIVPQGCPCSIVRAGGLNGRVRDGNGCVPSAAVTSLPAYTDRLPKSKNLISQRNDLYAMKRITQGAIRVET